MFDTGLRGISKALIAPLALGLLATTAASLGGSSCAPPAAATVAWWPGDGSAADISGNGNNGSLVGAVTATGLVGQAFSFNGATEVDVPDAATLNPTAQATMEAWINPSALPQQVNTFYNKESSSNTVQYEMSVFGSACSNMQAGELGIYFNTSSAVDDCSGWMGSHAVIPTGSWSHVAATYDGSQISVYVNGALTRRFAATGALPVTTGLFKLGARTVNSEHFTGLVDEPALYDRALSAGEIQAIYQAGAAGKCKTRSCATAPPGLAAWYRGEDAAGATAADSQGGNTGTLMNGATFAPGMVGQALHFDGNDDVLVIPDSAALRPRFESLAAWVKFDTLDSPGNAGGFPNRMIMTKRRNGSTTGQFESMSLVVGGADSSAKFSVFMWTASGAGSASSTTLVQPGVWYFVVGTYDEQHFNLYVNGTLEDSEPFTAPIESDPTQPFYIGSNGNPDPSQYHYPFSGLIDEAQVFGRALTAQEVAALYRAGSHGECADCAPLQAPPAGWYKGENNADDASPNANNGSAQGGLNYVAGVVGQAFNLNGSGQGVTVGNISALQTQVFSIDGWVKRGSAGTLSFSAGGGCVFCYGLNGYGVVLDDGTFSGKPNTLQLTQVGVGGANSSLTITDTAWHHVAVTADGSKVNFYLDGVADPSGPFAYAPGYSFGTSPAVGARGDNLGNSLLGQLDEVQVFPRVLSAAEVHGLYCAGARGTCASGPGGAFSFTDVTNAALNTQYASNTVTISGISGGPATIIFKGTGAYSIGNGPYTSAAGTVSNGDTVKIQLTSSSSLRTSVHGGVVINGVGSAYIVTTRAADITPTAFSFAPTTNATPGAVTTSATTVTISGLEPGYTGTPVSVTGGAYSLNNGPFTTAPGTVKNNDTLRVQLTASPNPRTALHAGVRVGTFSAAYVVTTKAR